ncbi:rhodanese-like domain-containing protein [Natrialbaceae archaeon A-gly3]
MDGEISTDDVYDLLEDGNDVRIVDIRNPASFERGHIPESENVPFNELPQNVAELESADHIVTVCPKGKSSIQAARLITSYEGTADATVESMAGGLDEWAEKYDLESDLEAAGESDGADAPF